MRRACAACCAARPPRWPRRVISVVIPVYNEEAVLPALFARLYPALDALGCTYEIVFVNDGSRDRSAAMLREQFQKRPDVTRVILFNGNFGQHMAIMAGFEHCRGERVVTLDADLQNPPEEIAKLLAKMDEGHDYVGSIRRERQDAAWRRWASRAMNRLRERLTHIRMTDQGCMLRAYDRADRRRDPRLARGEHVHPRARLLVRAQPDRGRGRARGAPRGRVQVLALQAGPPQLRPGHRLLGGAAAALLALRHLRLAGLAWASTWRSSCSALVTGEARRHLGDLGPRHPRVLPHRRACSSAWGSSASTSGASTSRCASARAT